MVVVRNGYKTKYRQIYKAWQSLRQRCNNPHDKDYHNYGGRGISVCDEWDKSSAAFIEWSLANGFQPGLSIDRIDVNGNYCPENCRWTTATQQARNRRVERINKTGVNGVHMDRGKFRAIIYVNNKKIDLGRHETLEQAAAARKRGEEMYWAVTS